jgi:hypothetical protein
VSQTVSFTELDAVVEAYGTACADAEKTRHRRIEDQRAGEKDRLEADLALERRKVSALDSEIVRPLKAELENEKKILVNFRRLVDEHRTGMAELCGFLNDKNYPGHRTGPEVVTGAISVLKQMEADLAEARRQLKEQEAEMAKQFGGIHKALGVSSNDSRPLVCYVEDAVKHRDEARRQAEEWKARWFPGATKQRLQELTNYLNAKQYPQLYAGQDVAGAALMMIQHFEKQADANAQAARGMGRLRDLRVKDREHGWTTEETAEWNRLLAGEGGTVSSEPPKL